MQQVRGCPRNPDESENLEDSPSVKAQGRRVAEATRRSCNADSGYHTRFAAGAYFSDSLVSAVVHFRNIKNPRLEFRTGELVLILPYGSSSDSLLKKYSKWIEQKAEFVRSCRNDISDKKLVKRTEQEFRKLTNSLVATAVFEIGVSIRKVYFRKMKTKWASCSSKGNITINRLMMSLPEYLLNYIIFHEVAHILESRHTAIFWKIISNKFPNFHKLEKELFTYWFLIHA